MGRLRFRSAYLALALVVLLTAAGVAFFVAPEIVRAPGGGGRPLPVEATQRPAEVQLARVTRVIDGDTIDVQYEDGTTRRVRLLGIDTPETSGSPAGAQCYGRLATEFTRKLLLGRTVGLIGDPTQDDVDRYDRQLRYVWLDRRLVNYVLVREGYAREYTFRAPGQYQRLFKEAESQAMAEPVGVWRECRGRR